MFANKTGFSRFSTKEICNFKLKKHAFVIKDNSKLCKTHGKGPLGDQSILNEEHVEVIQGVEMH